MGYLYQYQKKEELEVENRFGERMRSVRESAADRGLNY